MDTFLGTTDYTMDDRRRVPVPTDFRPQFDGEPIIMYPGVEGCVQVFTLTGFIEENQKLYDRTSANPRIRMARRRAFSKGRRQEKLDNQGRITLDAELVLHARLDKNIRVIGAGPYFEVWDRPTAIAMEAQMEEDYRAVLDDISAEDDARRMRGLGGAQ